jgi:hypothetical protein
MSKKVEVVLAAAPSVLMTLQTARAAVVNVATEFKGKTGEVIAAYAKAMCAALDLVDNTGMVTTKWFALKGKLKAPVTVERAAFKVAMIEAGHESNVNVYWQRVKEDSGYVTPGDAAKAAQSVDDKTLSELKTILNRIFKAESESVECDLSSEAKGSIIEAFELMGGDIEKIG